MVLGQSRGTSGLKIHDAASGKTWKLPGQPLRPVNVTSKYILYVKSNGQERTLCRARIALPK
jgi:hypothetical protein